MTGRLGGRGFTLVEIVVVIGILLALVAGFALYHHSGHRQSLSLDFHAAALQSLEVLAAHLQDDFDSLVPGPLDRTFSEPTPALAAALRVVSNTEGEYGLPLDHTELPITDRIVYRFDPASRRVFRNNEPIRAGPFESVAFTFFPARPSDPTPPFGDTLVVRVSIVPVEALERPQAAVQRAMFELVFHSPQGTANHVWEEWAGDLPIRQH